MMKSQVSRQHTGELQWMLGSEVMSRFAPARRLLWEILAGLLCCAPFLYLCWFSSQFFIDVASSDQWGLVKLIGRYLNGQLSFSDLWMQKNAHRILFPKLIMLPLAKATNWNHGYEVAVIIGCGLISYLLIAQQLVRVYREGSHQRAILWLNAVLLSVLLFSLSQYQNWLWGMQIQMWLCVSAAVGGLFILSASLTTGRVIAALLLGFVATHSFANGLVYWGAGLLPILLAPASSSTQRRRWLAIWLVFATLAVCSFFFGYRSQGSGLGELVHSPLQHLLYTLTYLGNPVAHGSLPLAVAAGVLSLALLVGLSAHLALSKGVAIRALLPFLSLALFALGSAAMTAVGGTTSLCPRP